MDVSQIPPFLIQSALCLAFVANLLRTLDLVENALGQAKRARARGLKPEPFPKERLALHAVVLLVLAGAFANLSLS